MFRAHFAVAGSPVLQVVAVSVLCVLLPFGSHLGRGLDEVVLCTEVVPVVCAVYLLNVIQEAFKRLSTSVLINERWESLVQLMESLEPRENIVRAFKPSAHTLGHLDRSEGSVQNCGVGSDKLLDLVRCKNIDVERCPLLFEEDLQHAAERPGEFLPMRIANVGSECDVVISYELCVSLVQPQVGTGAQSKKGRALALPSSGVTRPFK